MDPATLTIGQLLDYLSRLTIGSLVAGWAYLGWRGEWIWKRELTRSLDRCDKLERQRDELYEALVKTQHIADSALTVAQK